MSVFYDRFMQLCAEKRVSPTGVAKAIGLSNAAANGWKQGKIPYDVTLRKVALYFDVSPEWLLGEEEKPAAESSEPTDEAYQQIKEFVMNANEAEKADVMKYIDFIKSKRE